MFDKTFSSKTYAFGNALSRLFNLDTNVNGIADKDSIYACGFRTYLIKIFLLI